MDFVLLLHKHCSLCVIASPSAFAVASLVSCSRLEQQPCTRSVGCSSHVIDTAVYIDIAVYMLSSNVIHVQYGIA